MLSKLINHTENGSQILQKLTMLDTVWDSPKCFHFLFLACYLHKGQELSPHFKENELGSLAGVKHQLTQSQKRNSINKGGIKITG